MKKSILLLALISIALIFVTPQVNAADRDVGYSLVLPADNAAVVAVDCQAIQNISIEYVRSVELRDPGDMCSEAERKLNMPEAQLSCYFSDILINYRNQHGTRHRYTCLNSIIYGSILNHSCGGIGY